MNELVEYGVKIGLAALLAGAVGAERQRTGKWAGLRTFMLIAVGSAMLTDLSIRIGPRYAGASTAWDPARIAAQIVTGVGFIGAGTILQLRGSVRGLTTAAGIWVASAIGMAVGASFFAEATLGTVALLAVLVLLRPLARSVSGNLQVISLVLDPSQRLSRVTDLLEGMEIEPERIRVITERGERHVVVHVRGPAQLKERIALEAIKAGLTLTEEED